MKTNRAVTGVLLRAVVDHDGGIRAERVTHWGTRVMLAVYSGVLGSIIGALPMMVVASTALYGVGLTVFGASTLLAAYRGATVRVESTADHLIVRNPFRTYRFRWTNIKAIVDAQPWQFKGLLCPAVVATSSTRPVPMFAMVAWDRLINSEPAPSALRFAQIIRRWGKEHRVRTPALRSLLKAHP